MAAADNDEGLLVIGAGLTGTGNNNLQIALEYLLNGKCYDMIDVINNCVDVIFWRKAASRNPSNEEWRAFLSGCKAVVDLPGAAFYKELMEVYPNAKVVLSVRDPDKWFQSVSAVAVELKTLNTFPWNLIGKFSAVCMILLMIDVVAPRVLGPNFDMFDRSRMIASYHEHVAEVKSHVPPDRLLEFRPTDGWEPLCNFLGVEIPNWPYPQISTAEEIQGIFEHFKLISKITAVLMLSTIGGVTYLLYQYGGSLWSALRSAHFLSISVHFPLKYRDV